MVNIIYKRNSIVQTAYHVIWCTKYQKPILVGLIAKITHNICNENDWPIITTEIQPDNVHLFLTIPPAIAVATVVKILKGSIARKLFLEFAQLKEELWGGRLWSPSYYVGTEGNVSAETISHYRERSEHVNRRR